MALSVEHEEEIMSYKASVVIEKDEEGYYAYCPELNSLRLECCCPC